MATQPHINKQIHPKILLPLFLITFLLFSLIACNNEQSTTESTADSTTISADTADKKQISDEQKKLGLVGSDKLYCLFLDSTDLMNTLKQDNGYNKVIFRFSVPDMFSADGIIELKGYPARGHGHYGRGTTPMPVKHLTDTCSINLNPGTEYVFGNHEATRRELMKLIIPDGADTISFKYLKFKPMTKTMGQHLHVCYTIVPCSPDGREIPITKKADMKTKGLDIEGTNPTPPGNPE